MADDDAGGTVLGFPGGLTIPGPVGSAPPAPGADTPTLTALPTLAPPPSLLVAGNSDVGGGGDTTAAHADPGIPDSPQGQGIAAMSVVMMAGITVAAMRGAWNAAAYLKARHEHHRAIADKQQAAADKAAIGVEAARQKGRLQAGPEFGRSTRTSGGGGGRNSSGKNSPPAAFRSSSGSKLPGGSGSKTPSKGPGGASGGRTPSLGTGGRGGGGGGRKGALETSGSKGGGKPGSGGGKAPTTGTRNNSGGLSGAVRDRAADRVRNGPKPKTPTPTPTRTPGIRDAVRDRAADRVRNGPKPKTPTPTDGKGKDSKETTSKAKPDSGPKVRDAARARVADRITTGSWTPTGRKPVDLTKGSGSSATPATIRGALRHRTVGRILNGKKPKPDPAAPKVDLTKKPKGTTGAGAAATPTTIRGALRHRAVGRILNGKKPKPDPAAPAAAPKVDLTKKPKPSTTTTAGTATPKISLTKKPKPPTTAAGTAPKVNLRKKVRLTKKPRKPGPGAPAGTTPTPTSKVNLRKKVKLTKKPRKPGPGPSAGPTGSTGTTRPTPTGPASKKKGDRRRSVRGWWERAGARRSGKPEPDPSSSTSSATTAGPDPASAGGFGPPPGWGYAQGTTITVEQAGGQVWEARQREARRRAGTPAAAIPAARKGGTVVTVPVPTKAPNTQYADSDLTIYDVIESDADMAEEIMAGVDEAIAAAEGCEKMMTRLEALHEKIVDLKVPGVLEGWVLILAEKAVSVKAKAEALAAKLPAASEAIASAGENAERRHKPLADAVRDAGHAAPAERDYHVE
ncbi:hypothetical protein [Streptomyces sp. NPDC048623]|uniref:hypothetical protein n=1 Tax=Streptomyces sp. NPDC048623 TaxID=3155761 RepID=UPI003435843A